MSVSEEISAHIPYLRRFSRALSGSRDSGDAYVMATLEAILADPGIMADQPNVKMGLYRAFLKVWESIPLNERFDASALPGDERGANQMLETISARPRVAFLLSALESFDAESIAGALDCSVDEAMTLLERAGKEIADQMRTDVLIIEDEAFIALDLQTLVEDLGHRVIGIARTHREALAAVSENRPGLILADIQLADGSSGLEAVNQILGGFEVPTIFITAYPERFLTGAPPEPTFLVAKPFSVDSLKAIISQALFFDRRSRRKNAKVPLAAGS
jgi:DNA-directed RNA polymerase specialized sigma24 family protein